MMKRLTRGATKIIEKYLPDAYLFAIILSVVTFGLSMGLTGSSAYEVLMAWGGGIWGLLPFTAQMATILVFGYAFAKTPFIEKLLIRIATVVKTPTQAYIVTSIVGAIFSWLVWPAGLICGAFVAIELAKRVKGIHFPLLVASAYSGFLVFQMGLTGTHLILNTPGTWSEELIGLIPSSETFLTSSNLTLSVVLGLIVIPILMSKMAPDEDEVVELDVDSIPEQAPQAEKINLKGLPFNDWVENNYIFNLILGIGLTVYLVFFFRDGGTLTIDSTNMIFLAAGVLLTPTPIQYVKRCIEGASTAGGVIMQFPLYAGIQGMMVTTGLASIMAMWFVEISGPRTLPLFSFFSAGLANMFVPSGGSQWHVQGPIVLEAAQNMGASVPRTAMAIFYGDNWTNLIQPFWALPVLAIANMKAKDIMGYLVPAFIISGIIIGSVLVFWPI